MAEVKMPDIAEWGVKMAKAMLIGAAPDDYIARKVLADFRRAVLLAAVSHLRNTEHEFAARELERLGEAK